jgi:nicotinamide mononucleotide transporter
MVESYQYFSQLPLWELLAVISALMYVLLAANENSLCWPAAMLSTVIYTVIFYDVYLFSDSLLQVYYLVMAVYGWYCWRPITEQNNPTTSRASQQIQSWPLAVHGKAILGLGIIAGILGWLMARYSPASFPYLDALTTVFAVFATYLVAKKVLENWLYWIAIDALSIYLYLEKDLTPTALLFMLYVIIASYGYVKWATEYKTKKVLVLGTSSSSNSS